MIFPGEADDFLPTKQKADTTTDFNLAVCWRGIDDMKRQIPNMEPRKTTDH